MAMSSTYGPSSREAAPEPESDVGGMRVNGVEYGGSEGGRKDLSPKAGSDSEGRRRWKSSWVSEGSAR